MKQRSLAETGFLPKRGKVTRKAEFLAEMRTVVPCSWLEGLIEGVYPKAGRGRRPALLSGMVRIHLPIWTHESPLSWLSQECCGVDAPLCPVESLDGSAAIAGDDTRGGACETEKTAIDAKIGVKPPRFMNQQRQPLRSTADAPLWW